MLRSLVTLLISIALILTACTSSATGTGGSGAGQASPTAASPVAAATTPAPGTRAAPPAIAAPTPTPAPSIPPSDPKELPDRPRGALPVPADNAVEVTGSITSPDNLFDPALPPVARLLAIDLRTGEIRYAISASGDLAYTLLVPPGDYVVAGTIGNPAGGPLARASGRARIESGIPTEIDLGAKAIAAIFVPARRMAARLAALLAADPGSGTGGIAADSHQSRPIVTVRGLTGTDVDGTAAATNNPNYEGIKTVAEIATLGVSNGLFSVFGNRDWIFVVGTDDEEELVDQERDYTGIKDQKTEPQFEIRGNIRQWGARPMEGFAWQEITLELVDLETGEVIATKKFVGSGNPSSIAGDAGFFAANEFNSAMVKALKDRPAATPTPAATAVPTATPRPRPTATPVPTPTATPVPSPTPAPRPTPTATPVISPPPVIGALSVAPTVPGSSSVRLDATYSNIRNEPLNFEIDWGDGPTIETGLLPDGKNSLSTTHDYLLDGEFQITLTVCGEDAVCDTESVRLDVGATGPTGSAGPAVHLIAPDSGDPLSIAGLASDPSNGSVFALAETGPGASVLFGEPGATGLRTIWSLDSNGKSGPTDIAFDPTNSVIYVVGVTDEELPGQTSLSGPDAWIAKLDESGAQLWLNQYGTIETDTALSVAVNPSDGTVVVASTTEQDQATPALPGGDSTRPTDVVITKFSADGSVLWSQTLASTGNDVPFDLVVDPELGGVFVVGSTDGVLPGAGSFGGEDAFAASFSSDGELQWTRVIGTAGDDAAESIAIDDAGFLYIAGTVELELNGLAHAGATDAFVTRLASDGLIDWIGEFGGPGAEQRVSLAVDPDGANLFLSGSTDGLLGIPIFTLDDSGDAGGVGQFTPTLNPGFTEGSLDMFLFQFAVDLPGGSTGLPGLGEINSNVPGEIPVVLEALQLRAPGNVLVIGLPTIVQCRPLSSDLAGLPWGATEIQGVHYLYPLEPGFWDEGPACGGG